MTPAVRVVRVTRADGSTTTIGHSVPMSIQRTVFARDGLRCRYCAFCHRDAAKFHIDHVVPVSKGGTNEVRNLVVACERCNILKGTDMWTPISLLTIVKMRRALDQWQVLRSQGWTQADTNRRLRQAKGYRKGMSYKKARMEAGAT